MFETTQRYRREASAWIAIAAVGLGVAPSGAQERGAVQPEPTARAAAVVDEITVDGRLEEASWQDAPVASGFVQRLPVEGAPAEEPTEVRVLYDDDAVYVGALLFDSRPGSIARQLVRRDQWGQYDFFEVSFDPNLDHRTGYRFRVSAANVQRDEYLYDDGQQDDAWDAVWESAVRIDSLGWTVEIRIPLSQIRYEASQGTQTWGVNFERRRLLTNEETQFALVSQLQQGVVSQLGRLEGMQLESSAQRVELRPYILSSGYSGPSETGDPFNDGSDFEARAGVDLRYGLGSQFTVDATINPDFGQVEADPAVINLSAFETFFEERRPFFVEDARIFDFSLSGRTNRLFYSRRIGREPSGRAPREADFADVPDAATILGAAKLTGRTSSGLSVGALGALTQQERGRAFFDDTGRIESFVVEPTTAHGVLRLRQDFNDGASTVGVIGTLLQRQLPEDGSFDFLPTTALSTGVDWEYQWSDREWAFSGYVAGSHIRGDSTALIAVQRSSTHFFQRPDALYVELDSSATSMTGLDWRMTIERRRAEHWTGAIWAAQVSPGFEVNDLGFSNRQEALDGGARIGYREIQPGEYLRSYNARLFTFHNWSHDALREPFSARSWGRSHVAGAVNLSAEAEVLNYWELSADLSYRPETMSRTATRGGPLVASTRGYRMGAELRSDDRRRFSFAPELSYGSQAENAGSELEAAVQLELRPSDRVEVRLEPAWSRQHSGDQHVLRSAAVPFAPTYGDRYVFADLQRRELSLETRLDVVFTPYLSLQLFAQPLLSSGQFTSLKQLLAPESFAFDVFEPGTFASGDGSPGCVGGRTCVDDRLTRYIDFNGDGAADVSFDEPDFNVRSLIGNAVVRWEYRPGSTVFVVWQRRQRDELIDGRFDFGRDARALFAAPAENVFMVKLNYWFGL